MTISGIYTKFDNSRRILSQNPCIAYEYICYLRQGGYVIPGGCSSFCLLATLAAYMKTAERIFVKILPQIYLWKRKN